MKFIKIFLALSECELGTESNELEAFIGTLNDIYQQQGKDIFFQLKKCGKLSDTLDKESRKNEYGSQIGDSQYFYLLFGKTAEEYAEEEFDAALELFRKNGAPKIYTYFKELPEGENPEKNVLAFMERLDKQLGHYYSKFGDLDAVKLNFMLELVQDEQLDSEIEFRDGQAFLEEEPLLSLEKVPLYSGNETLQGKREKEKELRKEFAVLMVECGRDPLKEGLMDRMTELGSRRAALQEDIHTMEKAVLKICMETAKERHRGSRMEMDWREKMAITFEEQGNYEKAKDILSDPQWKKEIRHGGEKLGIMKKTLEIEEENQKEDVRRYIRGQRHRILDIKATEVDKASVKTIMGIYQDIVEEAETYQVRLDVLCEYAGFLQKQNRLSEGLTIAERLRQYYEAAPHISEKDRFSLFLRLGRLYQALHDFSKAEESLQAALEICRRPLKASKISEADVAGAYFNMGVHLKGMDKLDKAEDRYQKALEIYIRLCKVNPNDRRIFAGWNRTIISLGDLRCRMGQEKEAETLYRRALGSLENYDKRYEEASLLLTHASQKLAILLEKRKKYEEAEHLYRQSIDILLPLYEKNPDAYEENMASDCSNLALFLRDRDKNTEAEGLFRQARSIRYRLASKNPDLYKRDIAISSHRLADCLVKTGKTVEAAGLYKEALEIYRDLAKKDPKVYEIRMASVCFSRAHYLFVSAGETREPAGILDRKNAEAINLYEEALSIYCRLSKREPEIYEARKAMCCHELAACQYREKEGASAAVVFYMRKICWSGPGMKRIERLFRRAVEIYDRLLEEKTSISAYALRNVDCRIWFGEFLYRQMQYAEAKEDKLLRLAECEEMNEKALEILKALQESPKRDSLAARLNYQRAKVLEFWGQKKDVEDLLQKGEAYAAHSRKLAQKPEDEEEAFRRQADFRQDGVNNTELLAREAEKCHLQAGQLAQGRHFEEAEALYRRAAEIYSGLYEKNPMAYEKASASVCQDFALLLYKMNRDDEARQMMQEAVDKNVRFIDENTAKEIEVSAPGGTLCIDNDSLTGFASNLKKTDP